MGKRILDELKKWTLGEIIFYSIIFLASVVALPIVAVKFNLEALHILFALFAIITACLVCKRTFVGYCLSIVVIGLYLPFAFDNRIYSDMISFVLFLLPYIIVELIRWIKQKTNKPKFPSLKTFIIETITALAFVAILFYGSYKLMHSIDNVWELISTLSICCAALFLYLTTYADKCFSLLFLVGYFGLATTNWVFAAIYTKISYAIIAYAFFVCMIFMIRQFVIELIAFIKRQKVAPAQEAVAEVVTKEEVKDDKKEESKLVVEEKIEEKKAPKKTPTKKSTTTQKSTTKKVETSKENDTSTKKKTQKKKSK